MNTPEKTPSATCQACGERITGEVHRFSDDPTSAFCSVDCQLSKTEIEVDEADLVPVTSSAPLPVYRGQVATDLHFDQFCECPELYENQIIVPKRHSVVALCPKCGCVTQD